MKTIEEDLKEHLRQIAPWAPEWEWNQILPYLKRAAIGVGIIEEIPSGYRFTKGAGDPKAWETIWELIRATGITPEVEAS